MSLRDQMIRQLADIEGELHGTDQAEAKLGDAADAMGQTFEAELARRREQLGPAGTDPAEADEYLALVRARYQAAQCGELAEWEAARSGEKHQMSDVQDDAD